MDITYEKLKALVEAMGGGAELKEMDSGTLTIYTNRVNIGKPNEPLPIADMYNKHIVTFDEAAMLIKERHPFKCYKQNFVGEWVQEDGKDVYCIMSLDKGDEEVYTVLARYTNGWSIIPHDAFEQLKPSSTQKRHYKWILETLDMQFPLIPKSKAKDDPVIQSLQAELDEVNGDDGFGLGRIKF